MINKMTKYSFVLLNAQKDEFLEKLQALGLVDITRSGKALDGISEKMMEEIEAVKAEISTIKAGKDSKTQKLEARLAELEGSRNLVSHFGEFDPAKLAGLGVEVNLAVLSRKKYDSKLEESYNIRILDEDRQNFYAVVFGSCEGLPGDILGIPEKTASQLESEIRDISRLVDEGHREIELRKEEIPQLEKEIGELTAEFNLHLAASAAESAAEGSLAIFTGFAPVENELELKAEFDSMDIIWMSEEAIMEDNPPIKLKNNRFVQMFEVLTDMYGRPAYNGFDPTPYISVFFLLFFAMCMGDAGYGIVLVILGVLLRKVNSFKSLAPLVCTLGIATIVVGLFFHTFFSVDLLGVSWIPEGVKACMLPSKIAGYDGTMVLALIVGILHLSLAMIVKTVYTTRTQGFMNSLSVWGWTLFLVGSVIVGAVALLGVIDSSLAKWIIIVLGIISAIGIFPMRTPGKNPLINIGGGLWETYNTATGVLGDVLSYLRLYALGLAGSMLGFAFNDLAKMALGGGSIGGWIAFAVIVIIGHTLNVAMAALGAFVHPLRLNFLEFFKNSGYEAAGKVYNPLKK